ncbi:hypothetical protein BCR33DRAFT_853482 [Rhizoclosmatium globosum]|uniref:Uncharacterized protein n=1 Tax=Rhizoclosmatium globosum TaxID=329046 RepID=A0A1Y2BX63_9FUNG|nr:hypothetical protein BCR33DRAFT_853482 [Rhizoclosmatium globosum]|eukprot:ORY39328.1 hypothetical protein BCR33DRAFT_853482 [Rhizoclosmatium globosum]
MEISIAPVQDTLPEERYDEERVQNDLADSADDDGFFVATTFLERVREIVFSVMFFMVHGNATWTVFEYCALIIEDLQLVTFFISLEVSNAYLIPNGLLYSELDYAHMELKQFSVWFSLCVVAVFLMMANIVWVASGFVHGHHKVIWPIWTLRIFASILPTVLYLPILEVIVNPISCNRIDEGNFGTLATTPCSDLRRLPLTIVSVLAMAVYIPTSVTLTAVYVLVNLNQSSMFGVVLFYFPYYNPNVNFMRGGFFFGTALVGFVATYAAIAHAVTGVQQNQTIIYIMAGVYSFGLATGFKVSAMVYNYIQNEVQCRLVQVQDQVILKGEPIMKPDTLVFAYWTHVEIAARIATIHMDKRRQRVDETTIPHLIMIFKRGMEEFPEQSFLKLSYALYMFHMKALNRDARSRLGKLDQSKVPWDVKFQLYYINQLATQTKEADFLGPGIKLDITSYVENKKTDKDAKLNHYLAVQEMRSLWELLSDKQYTVVQNGVIPKSRG